MPVTPRKNSWKPLTLRRYRHVNFDKSQRRRGARIARPLRIALTSAEHGPELPFVLAALDRETALARLDHILTGTGESTPTPGDQP